MSDDIDTIILARLNDGRLGSDNGRHRRADRIVSLEVNIIQVKESHEVMFEQAGERAGEESYYSFVNCGTVLETRDYEETITKEHTVELEMTDVVKTSEAFTGKLTTSCKIPLEFMELGIGTEGTAAFTKDFTVTNRSKQVNSEKTQEVQKWTLKVPSKTKGIYKIATINGNKRIQFSGVVVIKGIYHYVIDNVWDQNAVIELALKTDAERTFPFTGLLTSIAYKRVDISKSEIPVSDDDCAKASAMPRGLNDLIVLDNEIGQQRFDAGSKN